MMNWDQAADVCEKVYGVYVNWEERYFICPECDEPIYEDDWSNSDMDMCPICEFIFGE